MRLISQDRLMDYNYDHTAYLEIKCLDNDPLFHVFAVDSDEQGYCLASYTKLEDAQNALMGPSRLLQRWAAANCDHAGLTNKYTNGTPPQVYIFAEDGEEIL